MFDDPNFVAPTRDTPKTNLGQPTRTEAPWTPYKIPATPDVGGNNIFSLCCESGAVSSKNPSQFLKWRNLQFPRGDESFQTLYWNPSAGNGGRWETLNPPSGATQQDPKFLSYNGSNLVWDDTTTEQLPQGQNNGDILYWNSSSQDWQTLLAPDSETLKVLTIQNGQLAWTETEDCE